MPSAVWQATAQGIIGQVLTNTSAINAMVAHHTKAARILVDVTAAPTYFDHPKFVAQPNLPDNYVCHLPSLPNEG